MIHTIVTDEVSVPASQESDMRSPAYRHSYHEIAEHHVVEVDVVKQLQANLAHLEDLHGRLNFMMKEITYLLKKG